MKRVEVSRQTGIRLSQTGKLIGKILEEDVGIVLMCRDTKNSSKKLWDAIGMLKPNTASFPITISISQRQNSWTIIVTIYERETVSNIEKDKDSVGSILAFINVP